MENHKIERILNPMLGKMWIYAKETHFLKSFNIGGNSIKLYCDGPKPTITILREDFEEIINQFYPIEREPAIAPAENNQVFLPTTGGAAPIQTLINKHGQSIAETILLNIQQVKADPTFIPQAAEINNQVKSLIDLAKVEVDMLRVASSLRR